MYPYRYHWLQCEESVYCRGCFSRFTASNLIYDCERGELPMRENQWICNRDYATYKQELKCIEPNQVYYEVHHIYEFDVEMEETGDLVPSSHNITVNQYRTIEEAFSATSCYMCGGVAYVIYEMRGCTHRVLESHYWWRGKECVYYEG